MMTTMMAAAKPRVALIAGASGLVGARCLKHLLLDPGTAGVHALGRRPLEMKHKKLTEHVVDFANLGPLPAADDAYCALGTTMKAAGSKEAFRAIDFVAVHNFAKAARAAGVEQFVLVTAMGADAKSSVFYNRTKGEVEEAVRALGFPTLHILHPGILANDGDRKGRVGEDIANSIMGGLASMFGKTTWKYAPIHVETVGKAMVALARMEQRGVNVHESAQLQTLGA